jgi:hypothetical protein
MLGSQAGAGWRKAYKNALSIAYLIKEYFYFSDQFMEEQ